MGFGPDLEEAGQSEGRRPGPRRCWAGARLGRLGQAWREAQATRLREYEAHCPDPIWTARRRARLRRRRRRKGPGTGARRRLRRGASDPVAGTKTRRCSGCSKGGGGLLRPDLADRKSVV